MDKAKKNKKQHKNKNKNKPEEMKQATAADEKKSPEEAESDTKIPMEDIEGGAIKKKKRIKKKKKKNVEETYKSSIFKVLKKYQKYQKKNQPDMNISCNAMEVMNSFIKDMLEKIAELASRRARFNHREILTTSDIEAAVHVLLPRKLARYAMVWGTKAISNVINHALR